MKQTAIKYCALVLTAVMLFTLPAFAQEPEAQNKDEVVYAKLLADGTVQSAFVVNSFELEQESSFTDYGSYTEVLNLTTTAPLAIKGDAVAINAPKGKYYYQGTLKEVKLPWDVKIAYTLDGEDIGAADLAGKSGKVQIAIDLMAASDANAHFDQNYTVQTAVTLDTEKCAGITAPDATIAAAGKNKVINFVKLPKENAHYVISFTADDFSMSGIQISAVPFSMSIDLPDTGDMTGDIASLQDAIRQLNDGTWKLADGGYDLSSGMGKFYNGLKEMHVGMNEFKSGFGELIDANPSIKSGSAQILTALKTMSKGMQELDSMDLSSLNALVEGSAQVKAGINGIAGGLSGISGSLAGADSLMAGNEGIIAYLEAQKLVPGSSDSAAMLDGMIAVLQGNNGLLGGLQYGINGDGTAANPGLAAGAGALAEQYALFDAGIQALPATLTEMTGGLVELKAGIDQMAANYGSFDSGLREYLAGVSDLYDGFRKLSSGFGDVVNGGADINKGMSDLYFGMKDLADGTEEMHSETADMDTKMQDKIDEMLADYSFDEFVPVSFVSEKNAGVELVQFVLMTEEITAAKAEEPPAQEPVKQNFWQRVVALFQPNTNPLKKSR